MRKIIVFIIFLIIIFIVNIIFYFLSEDYRIFLKNIKNKDNTVNLNLEEKSFNDTLQDEPKVDFKKVVINNKNDDIFSSKWNDWGIELNDDVTLWKNYLDIIDIFKVYDLKKLEVNSNLFDITDEYPDKYFEYYSADMTLYIFLTKTYTDIHDIFWVLTKDLPIKIKEVNNFWDKSFYINLNNDIEDRFIRLVISNKWVVFWLKIKKTEYDLVKEKLNSFRKD